MNQKKKKQKQRMNDPGSLQCYSDSEIQIGWSFHSLNTSTY